MNAEIIAVGTEILLGQIVNTNAPFVAKRLAALGIDVYYQSVVGDNQQRLTAAIKLAATRSNLVILIGGLGPTKDDLTKQTVAAFLGKELHSEPAALKKIESYFAETHKTMTANNRLQALYIADSLPLKNETGFAVGDFYHDPAKTDFLLLPGPPSELRPMFIKQAVPQLQKTYLNHHVLTSRVMRFFGIGESMIAAKLSDLIDEQTNPTLATYAKENEVTLRLTATGSSDSVTIKLLDQLEKAVKNRIGDYFYGYGDDNSLARVVFNLLKQQGLSITAAESLTAGKFQSTLADVPGVSQVFPGGFVTYSKIAKKSLLGIPAEVIDRYGVVSSQTAEWMAKRAQALLQTDIGISFTGVAGPTELEGQPAGTVWIGLSFKDQPVESKVFHFSKTRPYIRERTVLTGLDWIRRKLVE
ncbi:competence/damage-inducible protein A [Liquorilactobacillus vini]|uniref:Putative competence-damage inducible protein n=2 Tax=Liquorilactobacillus vini TaxID=238015 RepID=A0A0R2BZG7_9LACO|nr:competence/damage-inducible protein A [Liquorilactobacillus vini]KRM84245.1 competence damage-inducible protein A [Liquorilactobacillus vini DSM 20605]